MNSEERWQLTILKRRAEWLEKRAFKFSDKLQNYDRQELKALKWAIEIIEQVKIKG